MDLKEQLALIKNEYNIIDLVQEENISLKPSGPGTFKGLCPFHNEKTPSFTVNERFQNYRCFGCGESGDIFSFIEKTHGCSFMESVKYLADAKNISIKLTNSSNHKPKYDIKRLYELVNDAYLFYRNEFNKLDNNHPAKKEILKRNLSIENPVFGYAPESYGALYNHLKKLGYTEELMLQSELIGEKNGKYYDFFFKRLTIVLSDFNGKPVSFSAKKLFETDNLGKYINGKASPVFQKKATLFNLNNAKKEARIEKNIILTEGPFDVLAMQAADINNVVASCGTAFTEEHLRSARQIVGEEGKLIFAFDGDSAGLEAAMKVFLHFPIAHSFSYVLFFPQDLDPCDYYLKYGKDALNDFAKNNNNHVPITDFVLNALADKIKLTDMDSRYKFIRILCGRYLSIMTDNILFDYMIRKASVMSGLSVIQIKEIYNQLKTKTPTHKKQNNQDTINDTLHPQININTFDDIDECYLTAFSMLINYPSLLINLNKGVKWPKKFMPFLKEFVVNYKKYLSKKQDFRFIPEDYSDVDFAKYLQNYKTLDDEFLNDDELCSHYKLVIEAGQKFLSDRENEDKKSNILMAMNEAKSNKELLEMLKTLKQENLIH